MRIATLLLFTLAVAAPARAELKSTAADGFFVQHEFAIATPRAKAWAALLKPSAWWPDDHSWSGAAKHFSLDAKAGGCFCEKWAGGESEHARVIHLERDALLRLRGALGPLQEMGVTGVLTVKLADDGEHTRATVTYRVAGDSLHTLGEIAPVVDQVMGVQWGRYARYAATGKADE